MPFYLFVSPDRLEWASALKVGLRTVIADDSFYEYFIYDPRGQDVIKKSNLQYRPGFYLERPSLPKETAVNEKALWLALADL